jgi:MinD superfamily P-loop ATPase
MSTTFQVDPEACRRCQRCMAAQACPQKAFFNVEGSARPVIHPARCAGCGTCAPYCPFDAIQPDDDSLGDIAAD